MHADLSRITYRPERHYSAVVAQQGRVQLDADANEQTAIQLFQARTLAADLIGQHGGPQDATGFRIELRGGSHELDDLLIGGGRYYVDGIQCDATRPQPGVPVPAEGAEGQGGADDPGVPAGAPATWTYWDQPDGFRDPERPGDRLPTTFPYLAFLKVWERSVTAAEDPALREVALGAALPDTAARAKVVWQVLPLPGAELGLGGDNPPADDIRAAFTRWAQRAAAPASRLAARSERPGHADDDPCLVAPDARYRGPENQLYRVEVHEGGTAQEATFKWSRENGSVTFPVDELDGTWVDLATLGSDDKLDLNVGDRVEFVDTAYTSRGRRSRCCGWRRWTCRGGGCGSRTNRRRASDGGPSSIRSCAAGTSRRAPGRAGAVRGPTGCGTARCASRRVAGCRWRRASRCTSGPAAPTGPATSG